MKIFFLALILIPQISFSKEILSDKAIFRVAEEIIFRSDLSDIRDSLLKMRCLKSDGLTLNLLGLDRKTFPTLPKFENFDFKDSSSKDFIKKIILFKKAAHFIETQNIVLDTNLKAKIENDSCISAKYSEWSKDLKRFFELEIYIQKRYVAIKGKDQKPDLKQMLNSANLFLASLDQKIPHYVFF